MEETSAGDPAPGQRSGRARFTAVHGWSSTVIGLAALGISLYNLSLTFRTPEIDVSLPHVLRIGQQEGENAFVFLQPTVSTPQRTEDVEIITSMELELRPSRPADRSKRPEFWWDETITWRKPVEKGYEHADDPHALVIAQEAPQQPVLSFVAENWNFAPDTYHGTLTIHRASNPKPHTERFCLTITAEVLKEWQTKPGWWFPFRNDDPDATDQHGSCFSRWSGY
ncbi:hypothetical protein [Streptomyces xanthophaeus]|uniref:hypothetical protein n=1 Tax=Streptomyces xanthophaeus TaxID=67385 RepID=UPI003715A091